MSHPTNNQSIQSVRYYDCGYCVNQLAFVYRGHTRERRQFPSGVFLLKHPTQGYILYDTGYSRGIYSGLKGKLYTTFNPTVVTPQDEITSQLARDGIAPDDIHSIIISHLHPDHIGGIQFFPNSRIIVTEDTYSTYKQPRPRDLVFTHLFPEWFERQLQVVTHDQLQQTTLNGLTGYDVFGDSSLLLVGLPGHTQGHLGAYLPGTLLLAGDASWGSDLLGAARTMTKTAQYIQSDYHQYIRQSDDLLKLQQTGVRLCFSHEAYTDKELMP